MRYGFIVFVVCLSAVAKGVFAQQEGVQYNWQEKRNKNGISIYTSKVEGSPFKAVRGSMTIAGSVESLVALIEDLPACSDWADLCKEARLIERVSDMETFVYIYNDIPFPVSDRDVYVNMSWSIEKSTGKTSMTSIARKGGPDKTKAVRLQDAFSQWHFTPLGEGKVLVENFAHIDPNGPTPAWITNMLLVDSPFKSMSAMRDIIESGGYADASIPFLNLEDTPK